MKTRYFAIFAIFALALSACQSKIELEPSSNECKIVAYIDNSDTKTWYENDTQFSWVANDRVLLLVNKKEDGSTDHYSYYASSDGASVEFTGSEVGEAYEANGLALYPHYLAHGGTKGAETVTLPAEYAVSDYANNMALIPLIGVQDAQNANKYGFKTAVGVLKVTLSNIPVSARKLVLTAAEGDVLAGTFPLSADAAQTGLLMSAAESASNVLTLSFPQQTAGSSVDFYLPVPVGTIKAGAALKVLDAEDGVIKETPATVRDIPVERNKLLNLTPSPIAVEAWVSLGTGKYLDDHGFYYLSGGESLSRTAADYIDVEIEQKSDEPTKFRVKHPYTMFAGDAFPDPAEYLYLTVREDMGPGIVINDSFRYNGGDAVLMDNPYWGYDALYHNNRIIRYAADGTTPANIQLAQKYFGIAAGSNCSRNPKIEIVFPGSEPMLADHFNYVYFASAAYANGKVTANVPQTATAIKAVVAQSIAEGIEILQAGTSDAILTFTESGSQDVQLADGTYHVVYVIENDGHGYTFDASDAFEVTAGEVPIAAVTVSNNAGTYAGANYDGGGAAALIDGDTSTFWHSSYVTGYDGYYSYADLDATYGIYIDLDLGENKTVTNFSINACLRAYASSAGAGFPKHVKVYGSTDGQNWGEAIAEVADLKGEHVQGEWVDPIACATPAPIRYIRISILSNSLDADLCDAANATGDSYTHLAELKVIE